MSAFNCTTVVAILIAFSYVLGVEADGSSSIQGCHHSFIGKTSAPSFLSKNTELTQHHHGNHRPSLLSLRGGDSTDSIITINSLSQIQTILDDASRNNNNNLVVLDFTSNNCPPCEMIKPIYADMSQLEEFATVIFCKVNVSNHPDVAEKYGVDGWPTFLLFKDGEVVDSVVGGQAAKAGLYGLVSKHK